MESQRLNILIVGATGRLGALITKHTLLQPNLITNILVRNPKKNPELVESVQKAGGRVIQGDLGEPESLKDVTKGMHTVISTIYPVEEKVAVNGQIALIDDCLRNGVERFVPADFGGNNDGFTREEMAEILAIEYSLKVYEYLQGKPIKTLHFWPGIFTESFFEANAKEYGYWGRLEHKYDLTTYEDMARVVAAAVAEEKRTGDVKIAGESLTIKEITDIYNRVRRTNLVPKHLGSLDDLKSQWKEVEKASGPASYDALLLGILLFIFDDKYTFDKTNNNEFPEIQMTTVEEFLVQNPDTKLP